MALALTSLLILLMPPLFSVTRESQHSTFLNEEVMIFFNHLAQEVRGAMHLQSSNNGVLIYRWDGDVIRMQRQNNSFIMYQRNNQGQVRMLREIQRFACTHELSLLFCEVITKDGQLFERSFITVGRLHE